MKLPAYWSKATAEDVGPKGKPVAFTCWRSSDSSDDDARQSALAAAKRAVADFLAGRRREHYAYWEAPIREEVIERHAAPGGELIAAVTRNPYGSLVLNAARVMFVDLDFPRLSLGQRFMYLLPLRLFGWSERAAEERTEREECAKWKAFLDKHPGWSSRIYRTRAGLRALVTHDLFDPASEQTLTLLREADCDPLYVRLCKAQQCFRARLTPKPWRCGHRDMGVRWPYETPEKQQRFEAWRKAYDACQSGYATCRFLGAVGSGRVHPEAQTIIDLHDKATRCGEPLELA